MAYVVPNSSIELMSGVNLTPDYKDTIYFASESAQSVYFAGKIVKRFHNQMYTRISDGVCRVECNASEIRYCDYMRFRNDRVIETNKYYYAFITKVEYVNENVSEIHFVIDELQTWLFNQYCSLGMCFIERNHCTSGEDLVGANLVPEPLSVDETIPLAHDDKDGGTNVCILAIGTVTMAKNASDTQAFYSQVMFSGYPSTIKYVVLSPADLQTALTNFEFLNGLIKGITGSSNDLWAILGCYIMPSNWVYTTGNGVTVGTVDCHMCGLNGYESATITPATTSTPGLHGGSYNPKNAKLKTYPFMYFRLSTPISHQDLKYENFGGQNPTAQFKIQSTVNPVPTLTVLPVNYESPNEDFNYALTIDNFPSPPVYQSGVYGSLAQFIGGAIKNLTKAIGGAGLAALGLSAGIGTFAGNEMVYAGTKEYFGGVDSKNNVSLSPKNVQSGGGCTSLDAFMSLNNFRIVTYRMGLREQTAKLFDDFLSKYGYAQNKVGVPNLHARSKWTYVKTRGAIVNGGIPSTAKALISRVLDNGITFWDSATTVGDYGNDMSNP